MKSENNNKADSPFRSVLQAMPADFWRLWFVGMIASTVRWLETVVVGVVVYQQTGSAFVVAMMTMLRLLPMGLFGAFLGAFVERFDRRLTLAGVLAVMGMTSAVLGIIALSGSLEVWHLAVGSFVNGFGWTTDNPLRRMMMGEAVGRDRMGMAMAFDVGAANAARMVGPTVGGLLLVGIGIEGALLLGAALYAVSIAATLAVRSRFAVSPEAGAVLARTWEAVRIVAADKRLAAIMVVTIIYNVFAWPFTSMIPVIGRDRLYLGPEGVGLLATMDGIGAFVGAFLVVLWLTPRWYGKAYLGGVICYLIMVVIFALVQSPALAGAALLMTGLGGAGFATTQATLVYLASPPEMRSRILGVLTVCIGTGPIGFLWLGWLADRIGSHNATAVTGVLGLLAMAATWRWWKDI